MRADDVARFEERSERLKFADLVSSIAEQVTNSRRGNQSFDRAEPFAGETVHDEPFDAEEIGQGPILRVWNLRTIEAEQAGPDVPSVHAEGAGEAAVVSADFNNPRRRIFFHRITPRRHSHAVLIGNEPKRQNRLAGIATIFVVIPKREKGRRLNVDVQSGSLRLPCVVTAHDFAGQLKFEFLRLVPFFLGKICLARFLSERCHFLLHVLENREPFNWQARRFA